MFSRPGGWGCRSPGQQRLVPAAELRSITNRPGESNSLRVEFFGCGQGLDGEIRRVWLADGVRAGRRGPGRAGSLQFQRDAAGLPHAEQFSHVLQHQAHFIDRVEDALVKPGVVEQRSERSFAGVELGDHLAAAGQQAGEIFSGDDEGWHELSHFVHAAVEFAQQRALQLGVGFGGDIPGNHRQVGRGHLKPGENRGGRPRLNTDSSLEDRVRSRTANGQSLIEFLVKIMENTKERSSVRIAAAEQLLLRGWGKPTLPVHLQGEIDVTEHILIEFSDEELEAKLREGHAKDAQ